jgi:Ca-activated chloride channel homolog
MKAIRWMGLACAGALALELIAPAASAAAQSGQPADVHLELTQVDTSDFPRVTVYVSALDASGQPVGIDPAQLILDEDGQPITPDEVQASGPVDALTVMLVMDVSGSMNRNGKLTAAKQAADAFIGRMEPQDKVGLMSFDTQVQLVQPPTSDKQRVTQAVSTLYGVKDTAIYDALVAAEGELAGVPGRKAIILLTDGMDNRSTSHLEDVVAGTNDRSLTISVVGLGDPSQPAGSWAGLNVAALSQLANQAGGQFALAADEAALVGLFERYSKLLHTEVAIRYTSPSRLKDGLPRQIGVRLAAAPSVQSQSGYNPGGLVPEVARPAAWPVFGLALLGLLGLLGLPWAARRVGRLRPAQAAETYSKPEAPLGTAKRIRLH